MGLIQGLHGTAALVLLCGLLFAEEAGVPCPSSHGGRKDARLRCPREPTQRAASSLAPTFERQQSVEAGDDHRYPRCEGLNGPWHSKSVVDEEQSQSKGRPNKHIHRRRHHRGDRPPSNLRVGASEAAHKRHRGRQHHRRHHHDQLAMKEGRGPRRMLGAPIDRSCCQTTHQQIAAAPAVAIPAAVAARLRLPRPRRRSAEVATGSRPACLALMQRPHQPWARILITPRTRPSGGSSTGHGPHCAPLGRGPSSGRRRQACRVHARR
jgi:hypothetical protein